MADWLSSFACGVSPRMEGGWQSTLRMRVAAACLSLVGCRAAVAPSEAALDVGAALDRAVVAHPDVPALVAVAQRGELLVLRAVSGGPPSDTCADVGLLATSLLQQRLAQSGVSTGSRLGAALPEVESALGSLALSELASHRTSLPDFRGAVVFEPPTPESVLDAVVSALPDEAPAPRSPEASVANLYLLERALTASDPKPPECRRGPRPARGAHAAIPSPIATADELVRALSRTDATALPFGAHEALGEEPLWTATHEEPGARAFAAWLPREGTAVLVLAHTDRIDPEPLGRDLLLELRGSRSLHDGRSLASVGSRPDTLLDAAGPEFWRGTWELVPEDAARMERELPPELRRCLAHLVVVPVGSNVRVEPACLGPVVLTPIDGLGGGFADRREGLELRSTPGGPALRVGAFSGRLQRRP